MQPLVVVLLSQRVKMHPIVSITLCGLFHLECMLHCKYLEHSSQVLGFLHDLKGESIIVGVRYMHMTLIFVV